MGFQIMFTLQSNPNNVQIASVQYHLFVCDIECMFAETETETEAETETREIFSIRN